MKGYILQWMGKPERRREGRKEEINIIYEFFYIRYRNTTHVLNSLSAPDVYDKRIRPYHEGRRLLPSVPKLTPRLDSKLSHDLI